MDFRANINKSSGKGSPNQCAILLDDKEMYVELLSRGADVNVGNFYGYNTYQSLYVSMTFLSQC